MLGRKTAYANRFGSEAFVLLLTQNFLFVHELMLFLGKLSGLTRKAESNR